MPADPGTIGWPTRGPLAPGLDPMPPTAASPLCRMAGELVLPAEMGLLAPTGPGNAVAPTRGVPPLALGATPMAFLVGAWTAPGRAVEWGPWMPRCEFTRLVLSEGATCLWTGPFLLFSGDRPWFTVIRVSMGFEGFA